MSLVHLLNIHLRNLEQGVDRLVELLLLRHNVEINHWSGGRKVLDKNLGCGDEVGEVGKYEGNNNVEKKLTLP